MLTTPNRDTEGCPDLENITYVKDTNNRLDQFIGIWKGTYGGKQYEIKLEKKLIKKVELLVKNHGTELLEECS